MAEQPNNPRILVVAGTRPELVKLAPVLRELRQGSFLEGLACFSGQHVELLESVLGEMDVRPDVDLRVGSSSGSLSESLACLLERLDQVVSDLKPDGVVVQGDTNTALAGAMVAFHKMIPSFHIEAGLRTPNPRVPFPEEMNRRLISQMARLHFAPTDWARNNLIKEGIGSDRIILTGNTGIDTLRSFVLDSALLAEQIAPGVSADTRKLVVTLHRRENMERVVEVTDAMKALLAMQPDIEVLWILHLNPTRHVVIRELAHHSRVHLLEPLAYSAFVALMRSAYVILSDSGGVQEEAPALGTPVLVLRDETERPEAVEARCACLVGCHRQPIVDAVTLLLRDRDEYVRMARPTTLFGDGHASERIVAALGRFFVPSRSIAVPPALQEGKPSWCPPRALPDSLTHPERRAAHRCS